jgi:glycosyltransferase involved in cell wall biosynthesis
MKLALISSILGFPWGSPDRLWSDLAERVLARRGQVFLAISPQTAAAKPVARLQQAGAELFLRRRNSLFLGGWDRLARRLPGWRARYLEHQLNRFRPDVIVITQGGSYDASAEHYLVDWLEAAHTPYVVISHNNSEAYFPAAVDLPRLRRFFDNAAAVLFVSSHNREWAVRRLGLALPRAQVIQNPLAFHRTAAEPWPLPSAAARLGFVGRVDIGHKGLDLLVEALAPLATNNAFELVLTGRCDDPAAVRDLATRFGLGAQVRLESPVHGTELAARYGAMELFLLTSRYEGCPSSMIEALMCGRPVLATPVGGVSDWISDGENGFIAEAVSAAAIRATLERAFAQRARWASMGAAARRRFEERGDPDPVQTLLNLVDRATQAGVGGAGINRKQRE